MNMIVDMLRAEAVVAYAAGAVAELQVRVLRIRPAADGALVGVEPVGLLSSDAGGFAFEVDGAAALLFWEHAHHKRCGTYNLCALRHYDP